MFGEQGIGRFSVGVAMELKDIHHDITTFCKIEEFIKTNKLPWNVKNVRAALNSVCGFCKYSEIKQKKQHSKKAKALLTQQTRLRSLIAKLSISEKRQLVEDIVEETAQIDIVKNLEKIDIISHKVFRSNQLFTEIITEYAKFILEPSLCDTTKFTHFGELE